MQVELGLCFRPGDLVRAEVLSLGDSHSYYLTTAKNELGVTEAKGLSGNILAAYSPTKQFNCSNWHAAMLFGCMVRLKTV